MLQIIIFQTKKNIPITTKVKFENIDSLNKNQNMPNILSDLLISEII